MRSAICIVALAACWSGASPAPTTVAPVVVPARHAGPSAEARVRAILAAQLAASELDGATRDEALHATFADDAVISIPGGSRLVIELAGDTFANRQIAALDVGGDAEVVWFAAELTQRDDVRDPGAVGRRRGLSWASPALLYAGVARRDAGWKIAAASLLHGRGSVQRGMSNATPATRLTRLALDGPAVAAAIDPRAIVIAPGQARGRGGAGLGPWATRVVTLDGRPREIVEAHWASVQADVVSPDGRHGLFLVARPTRAGGWKPVLVQYLGR